MLVLGIFTIGFAFGFLTGAKIEETKQAKKESKVFKFESYKEPHEAVTFKFG